VFTFWFLATTGLTRRTTRTESARDRGFSLLSCVTRCLFCNITSTSLQRSWRFKICNTTLTSCATLGVPHSHAGGLELQQQQQKRFRGGQARSRRTPRGRSGGCQRAVCSRGLAGAAPGRQTLQILNFLSDFRDPARAGGRVRW
jgi:hypothetical protein